MIPLLINQSNISRDFSLQLSKCLADSDLVVTGLTGIGPIRKIFWLVFAVLAQWKFLYYIDRFDHIKVNKSKLIDNEHYMSKSVAHAVSTFDLYHPLGRWPLGWYRFLWLIRHVIQNLTCNIQYVLSTIIIKLIFNKLSYLVGLISSLLTVSWYLTVQLFSRNRSLTVKDGRFRQV